MSIYLLIWGLALISSLAIWFGLRLTFKVSNRVRPLPTLLPPPQEEIVVTSPREPVGAQWVGGGRKIRADNDPFYMCVMWALFFASVGMLISGPIHPSTIESMTPAVQRTMAGVLCLGTGTCILGFLSGTRWFRPNADLRECYHLAVVATPANISTLTVYIVAVGNTSHWNPAAFVFGAGGILAILIAHLWMAWDLFREIKRLNERVAIALRSISSEGMDDGQGDH